MFKNLLPVAVILTYLYICESTKPHPKPHPPSPSPPPEPPVPPTLPSEESFPQPLIPPSIGSKPSPINPITPLSPSPSSSGDLTSIPIGLTNPLDGLTFAEEWSNWKLQNEKRYSNLEEESFRRYVWLSNKMYIVKHNLKSAEVGYELAMNQFGDLTHEEWKHLYLSDFKHNNFTAKTPHSEIRYKANFYPESLDWRSKNAVSPVKNQGKCDASYAFAAIGALEGAASLAHNKLIMLSEQNVIDCSIPHGNHGCNGGTVSKAYQYMISIGGVDKDDSYPYTSRQDTCHYKKENSGTTMSGFITLAPRDEEQLLAAVATVGPVSVTVDGSSNAFRFYSRGVFDTIHCSTTNLNHAMVITGYGITKDGHKYWLVKNSWGTMWGEKGYVLMARDQFNQCGIASDAAYPTL